MAQAVEHLLLQKQRPKSDDQVHQKKKKYPTTNLFQVLILVLAY
jgi:hypothetical protein